jgi:hypothetical protein
MALNSAMARSGRFSLRYTCACFMCDAICCWWSEGVWEQQIVVKKSEAHRRKEIFLFFISLVYGE